MAEPTILTDGAWHRLHPMTPLLRGGIVGIAIIGFLLAQLRERIIGSVVGDEEGEGDLIDMIVKNGLVIWAILAAIGVVAICVFFFWLSWRLHTFRVTDDAVEVRSGMISRTYRNARLDRIQGVNVTHPIIARIFGAAKLEISVAGQNANVQLSYLSTGHARSLRAAILRLASGAQRPASPDETVDHVASPDAVEPGGATASKEAGVGDFVTDRARDLFGPELDADLATPESVVRISWRRILGSMVVSGPTIVVILGIAGVIVGLAFGKVWPLAAALPIALGLASFYLRRFTRSVRYSIAGTPDGVRIGFGLASTTNETLPPGRIHAIEVRQPLLWRSFGWWQIQVNTAGHSQQQRGAANQSSATILPVGDRDDVVAVLKLLQPNAAEAEWEPIIRSGMTSRRDELFVSSPRRARYIHPFEWRRTGYAIAEGMVHFRLGIIWRKLTIVPLARLQSTSISQGPFYRRYRLITARLHTVAGPVTAELPAVDRETGLALFDEIAQLAIDFAASDTSHRWAEGH